MKTQKENQPPRARARCPEEIEPAEPSSPPDSSEELNIERVNELRSLLKEHGARARALSVLMEALSATRAVYCPKTKTMYQEPDHRVRASAAVDILCFTDGKPIERREQVNINLDGSEKAQERILSSPSLRDAIRRKIDEAETMRSQAERATHSKIGVENPAVA